MEMDTATCLALTWIQSNSAYKRVTTSTSTRRVYNSTFTYPLTLSPVILSLFTHMYEQSNLHRSTEFVILRTRGMRRFSI